jgi:hypothetical protein
MRRRDFIKGIAGSAAAAWSLAVQAQQQPAIPVECLIITITVMTSNDAGEAEQAVN